MPRLNVWHRLGVVISVLWVIYVTLQLAVLDPAPRYDQLDEYMSCLEALPNNAIRTDPAFQACDEVKRQEEAGLDRWVLLEAFLVAIASLVIIWGLFLMVRFVVRWVLAGRNPA